MRKILLLLAVALALIAGIHFARSAAGEKMSMPAPEFPKTIQWLHSEPLTMASLRGQVVVLHFWTFGCVNCQHNYPTYKAWHDQYRGKAVKLVGVHTPEFPHEANSVSVEREARSHGLKYPIVIDNDSAVWKSWHNQYWPSIYLIDKKGQARYRWDGELHLDTDEGRSFAAHIDELLAE
jgi:thiol-disulfide isomerase/thioredoxin